MVIPTEYDRHLPHGASQPTKSQVQPPESVRIRIGVRRPRPSRFGSRARPVWCLDVVRGGVGARAHDRSRPANGSPAPPRPWSTNPIRVASEELLPGRGGVLLLGGVRQDEDAVDVHDHSPACVWCRSTEQPPDVFAHFGAGGAERSRDTSAGQSPPARRRAPHPAGPCPDRAPPRPSATVQVPSTSPHPDRTCGLSRPAAPPRGAGTRDSESDATSRTASHSQLESSALTAGGAADDGRRWHFAHEVLQAARRSGDVPFPGREFGRVTRSSDR